MVNIMATRTMTPKLFARANIKGSPEEFLTKHLDWLREHSFLDPLLDACVGKEITAKDCIDACREALLVHEIQGEIEKAKASMQKSMSRIDEQPKYTATIYVKFQQKDGTWGIKVGTQIKKRMIEDEHGKVQVLEEEKDLVFTAHLFQVIERIAILRLAKREDAVFCEIENHFGKIVRTNITRDQALGQFYGKTREPFMKRRSSNESKPYCNYPRAHNDYASFSRG